MQDTHNVLKTVDIIFHCKMVVCYVALYRLVTLVVGDVFGILKEKKMYLLLLFQGSFNMTDWLFKFVSFNFMPV